MDGDQNAFSEMYRLSYRSLYAYGLSFKVSGEQIRDVIQDLFLKLYTQPQYIKDVETIRPFLFASMRNACLNILKGESRYTDLENFNEFEVNYSIDNSSFEEKEEENERINSYIKTILEKLTSRQKEIIYLRFLHQMDYEEISDIMNMSEQAARNLTHRAISKLRKDNDGYELLFLALLISVWFQQIHRI